MNTVSQNIKNKIKNMNDNEFIEYVRTNYEFIENIIINIPKTMYKIGKIHPEEIFSIIMSETIDAEDIDPSILRDYLSL
jgi:hypothetical protein